MLTGWGEGAWRNESGKTKESMQSTRRRVSMIAAVARNNVIGKAGKLPWSIPQDFRYFLQKTTNQIAVMGTNCFLEADHPASLIIVLTHGSELQPYKEVLKPPQIITEFAWI